jgi:threonyl-tRNA synthetase
MFTLEIEGRDFGLKPMNCPGHCLLYSQTTHSYRDLPLRLAEAGNLHRNELSGVLQGLLRVRHFVQDDAHIFCTEEQVHDELVACLDYAFFLYDLLGIELRCELSTRPENRLGTDEEWDRAEAALDAALAARRLEADVSAGEGSFYGPKIDLHMTDSLGRSWQLGTVQLDYQMPKRFGLVYAGADNAEHTPALIHRALLGSFERFLGVYLEHTAGELPVWLAPVQARVLPVAEDHLLAAAGVAEALQERGVRADVDEREETLGRRIRDAELEKLPYVVVVGDKEVEQGTLSLRIRGQRTVVTRAREAALAEIQQAATL